jgi:hypothetical protein
VAGHRLDRHGTAGFPRAADRAADSRLLPISRARRRLHYPEWAPTVALEIASPDQDREELSAKCSFYVEAGSRLAILVLPETDTLEVFSAGSRTRQSYFWPRMAKNDQAINAGCACDLPLHRGVDQDPVSSDEFRVDPTLRCWPLHCDLRAAISAA